MPLAFVQFFLVAGNHQVSLTILYNMFLNFLLASYRPRRNFYSQLLLRSLLLALSVGISIPKFLVGIMVDLLQVISNLVVYWVFIYCMCN